MKNSDFYDFGEQIQKVVQSAIDSNDFRSLNESVRQTVNDAVGAVRSGVSQASESLSKSYKGTGTNTAQKKAAGPQVHQSAVKTQTSYKARETQQSQYFSTHPAGEVGGTLMVVLGFLFGTMIGIALAILVIIQFVLRGLPALIVPIGILLVLFVVMMVIGIRGRGITTRIKRFRTYRKVLDDREFCDVSELAAATGKADGYVVKDLQDMIGRQMFRQGHLDKQKKCLMVTNSAYNQYLQAQKGLEEREAKAQEEKAKISNPKYSDEVRAMLVEGNNYVKNIQACNAAIPDPDISAKISRLELIVSRIFAQVEKDPSLAPELHQFMNYYLPTTQKLLNVYKELDNQPVQGQNISETKKEIEDTLDTINQAFENLLDSCYKDTAWDVSTDISVLHTMLAKEGLTSDDLHKAKTEK
ncbi:MAG: 5-bromo-4-chloroindolyl phosphate hydrolysis family protein [Lachnospiraceae bacterium]|nr:5-bromo-4-chloroindolyl phosphate hydrolysis family protein [Lachnospiraceae bacterium]NCD01974.1 5-bromo-4-chloroindolyl phosphate hydrolysis protein [Clostridia bacterium]